MLSEYTSSATLLQILCNVALHYPHILVYNCVERCYSKTNEENNEQVYALLRSASSYCDTVLIN